jgi:hypothetical protein
MNLKYISLASVLVTDQDKAKDGNNWLITQERDGS